MKQPVLDPMFPFLRVAGVALIAASLACGSSDAGPAATTPPGPAPVATVSVNPPNASLQIGGTQTLTATLKDAAGNGLSGRDVAWSSSDQTVASVSSGGFVIGIAPGNATITATSEGKSGSSAITVIDPVATVSVTLSYASVMAGQSLDAQAVARNAAGAMLNRTVAWSSSSPIIASVSDNGLVSTLGAGSVSIVATVDGKSASAPLVVQPPPAADANLHVEFSPVVYPAQGGKGLNVILDGRAGTTDASITIRGVRHTLQRIPQTTRFVVTLPDAELTASPFAPTGALPGYSMGGLTVTTAGATETASGVVGVAAGAAVATITPLGSSAQRSAYTVNIRQDDFDPVRTAQQFFQHLPDVFDYLVLHNTATVVGGPVYFVGARNAIGGLGQSIYNSSATYGASPTGKLRGLVNYTTNAPPDLAHQVLTHEMGHAFCCYITGSPLALSGHWSLSTATFGIMGTNSSPGSNAGSMKLTPLGNGSYRVDAQSPYSGYTNLELYLLGLADSSEVEPQFVFSDQTQKVSVGAVLVGPTTTTTIHDIVAANGLRPLEYSGTPITYRAAFVVVSRGRLLTAQEMAFFDVAAQRGEATSSFDGGYFTPFFVNTRGRGILVTKLP